MVAIGLALLAAFLLALASTIEQQSARQRPASEALKPRLVVRLAREPKWLLGIGLATLSLPIQATALHLGQLLVVEPILAMGIALVVPLEWVFTRRGVRGRDVVGAAVVSAGLAVFLVVGRPSGGKQDASAIQWAVAGGVAVVAAMAAVSVGARLAPGERAGLFGVGAGVLFGLQSALLKATVSKLGDGFPDVLANWHIYALIATGAAALILEQSAYQTGRLAPSASATKLMGPVTAVMLGLFLLEERLSSNTPRVEIVGVALFAALAGLAFLTWSRAPSIGKRPKVNPRTGISGRNVRPRKALRG